MSTRSSHAEVAVPGEPTQTGTALLETATGTIQGFAPINSIHQHLCAFHFYAHDMSRQVEAHHFCAHLNEDVRQCLIFDSPDAGARLIGVEYIVTEPLFLALPDDEKPLWHSHEYEVREATSSCPACPDPWSAATSRRLPRRTARPSTSGKSTAGCAAARDPPTHDGTHPRRPASRRPRRRC
uniref:Uncharacterized protein n=1 Tax=Ananas comosus var. bracteatus TaxID=296719 RepID=A0A6V7NP47_ANACO|nr:unnamed protein product [Ananas comosus var. bracteatus]